MVVVWLKFPLVPVTVIVAAPTVAMVEAVKVRLLVPVVDPGLKLAVTPAGKPLAASATVLLNPFCDATVMVLLPLAPWATDRLAGFADIEKSACVPVTVRAIVALWVRVPLVPTMEMFVVPDGVLVWALKFTTIVPLPLTDEGLKLALTPVGNPLAEMETLPVKPNSEATVSEAVGLDPGVIVTAAGGAAVMEKSGRPTTVSWSVVAWVIVPLVPVTVTATGPEGTVALAAAVNVIVLTPSPLTIEAGLKAAVTPVGRPLMLRSTVPEKPFTGSTVMDVVPVAPCSTLVPLPDMLNVGFVSEGIAGKAFWMFEMNSAAKN
jgi:hypothetical protein